MAKKGRRSRSEKLAWIVSRVFDPVFEIPVLLGAAVYYALTNGMRFRFLIFLMVVNVFLPAVYMLRGLRNGSIADWDMTRREERRGVYLFTVFMHLISVVFAFSIGKVVMGKILVIFWTLGLVFALVTRFWKISVHGGVNGVALAFFNHFWGWKDYWWLSIVVLVVLWSRVMIKKHTWSQVSIGTVLAVVWVEVGLRLVGL